MSGTLAMLMSVIQPGSSQMRNGRKFVMQEELDILKHIDK